MSFPVTPGLTRMRLSTILASRRFKEARTLGRAPLLTPQRRKLLLRSA
jgi:hypothetical protein